MKRSNSLLIRYLLIILLALLLLPMIFPLSVLVYYLPETVASLRGRGMEQSNPYPSRQELTEMWHKEALQLDGAQPEAISARLADLHGELGEARMFWVDGERRTVTALPWQELPERWTAGDSIVFMKKSYGGDPFTVVAFIGEAPEQGFMVLQVDHAVLDHNGQRLMSNRYLIGMLSVGFLLFLFLSWSFFYRFRKRLVLLEQAMSSQDREGIPYPVEVKREDEIGQLEHAFNRMIEELRTSRGREAKEEALRKQLIASLSHDLRTPLTIIRSHAYTLGKDELSPQARQSVALIETKADDLHRLIDNLLSYSLLAAGKYPLERRPVDMVRFLRATAAGWYPLLEAEGFEIQVSLPEQAVYWQADPQWLTRILDNLLQNVVRHAKSGRYAGILLEEQEGRSAVVIEDKGPGLHAASEKKGAGIGLEIVALMAKELGLGFEAASTQQGSRMILYGPRLEEGLLSAPAKEKP